MKTKETLKSKTEKQSKIWERDPLIIWQLEAVGDKATWGLPLTHRFTSNTVERLADSLMHVSVCLWRGCAHKQSEQQSSCTSCHSVTSVQTHTSGQGIKWKGADPLHCGSFGRHEWLTDVLKAHAERSTKGLGRRTGRNCDFDYGIVTVIIDSRARCRGRRSCQVSCSEQN